MNPRQRFRAVMDYRPFDRLPVYYFGYWPETLVARDGVEREGRLFSQLLASRQA
jgi:hypothetical protein